MRTSELIALLQGQLERHGDLGVVVFYDAGYASNDVEGVFLTKDGDLAIDADEGHGSARKRWEAEE